MLNLFKKLPETTVQDAEDAGVEAERTRLRREQVKTMKELGFETSFDEDADLFNWHRQFELLLELRTRIEKLEGKQ